MASEENRNPLPCFLKDFTLNKPNNPINVIIGKIHNQGLSKKLWNGFGSITCQTKREIMTKDNKIKLR